ncbi:hypothetical protein ACFY3G_30070 [Streptomyces phaeochromogenes]|uniref:hypothetical protein n=1 Tax=Streptomyces phaeochromogenes TaxID=1923 RepID=UPI0036CDDC21
MPRPKGLLLFTAVVCCAAVLTGCSDDDTPSSVSSAAGEVVSSAFASATAKAGRELDEIKSGVDVKSDVKLAEPGKDNDGRATVEITAANTTNSSKSFAVQVDFTDTSGNRLDVVVVTVSGVAADKTGTATARSNRELSGEVKTKVARAVRY